jgi:hypothetical protein
MSMPETEVDEKRKQEHPKRTILSGKTVVFI